MVKESPPGGRDGARLDSVKINVDDQDQDATEAFEREQQQVSHHWRSDYMSMIAIGCSVD